MKKIFLLASFATLFLMSSCNKDEVCSTGYTGSSCTTQITPSKILVTKIDIIRFPGTDSGGSSWDLFPSSGPDIYPTLERAGNEIYNASSSNITNADPNTDYRFTLSQSIELSYPLDNYIIRLYDYDDTSGDDYMGGVTFSVYDSSNNFPSTLTIDGGGDVAFKLHLEYIF
jgi:hypothetical protein